MKSANDGLWTEQRMWLRSLLEVGYLHYPNPYLFLSLALTLTPTRRATSTTLTRTSSTLRESRW